MTDKGKTINVQASWYGFPKAPQGRQKLNTRQLYIRSTDHGRTWSKPKPLNSSGTYYTRGRSRILQLPDGGLLWMCYDMNQGGSLLDGTIHRSDDDGKTWRIVSIIRRRKPAGDHFDAKDLVVSGDVDRFLKLGDPKDDGWIDTDEGDLGRLSSGRLVLVVRPDGGTLVSDDQAKPGNRSAESVPSTSTLRIWSCSMTIRWCSPQAAAAVSASFSAPMAASPGRNRSALIRLAMVMAN